MDIVERLKVCLESGDGYWPLLLCDAAKEIERLRANNKDLTDRNAILRQRPDLPVDRIPAHGELVRLQERVRELESALGRIKREVSDDITLGYHKYISEVCEIALFTPDVL